MEDSRLKMRLVTSLDKVFPNCEPKQSSETAVFTALQNETFSFQTAVYTSHPDREKIRVRVDSKLEKQVHVREVRYVAVQYPCHEKTDAHYLSTQPGLYPDLLCELHEDEILYLPSQQWHSLWIEIDTSGIKPGTYPITVVCTVDSDGVSVQCAAQLTIYNAQLAPQTILRTEWMHTDCLANYYHVAAWSEEHWSILENFIRAAANRGMNMMLTPTFTPPLDTQVGGERMTVQLVGVQRNGEIYNFDFSLLNRWTELCESCGIQYFEIAHLFTQWGAKCAPKVMAMVEDGSVQRIFGWDTPAVGEYSRFLQQYLPALTQWLRKKGLLERTYFHVSDEPKMWHIDSFKAAYQSVETLLEGLHVIDALSDYEFYEKGLVRHPVPAINHIHDFIDHQVPHLWSYYCTSQYMDVCNRFMSMPSQRSRIYGVLLYKYQIEGTLHWGYNFYNAQYSTHAINPYAVTDADGAFPAGDPFLVYPGEGGVPEESIRMMVCAEAMQDLRAFQMLEQLAGRDFVMQLIEEDLARPITFYDYPHSDAYLL
ncbi:MAG: DUF4091 domain-containing protein, partial [Ruthenibacterium sp.]